ncbi:hypothetical protein BHE74_00011796 [Ensete ventricosum]|nr:hypothetical protein GW17_00003240 [Ensete ventricosum]RWW79892.1 hypothetical protein BHE74_00011796 [Ensete ventricosum]RZS18483.1 hypothetical protein BHM03_00050764 [Ensete ventricosum]
MERHDPTLASARVHVLLTSVQVKLRASALYFIFYVNSFHAAWMLHQVPPKLLHPSFCIELMVALALPFHRSTLH